MSLAMKFMFAVFATALLLQTVLSEIEGHSGIVFHVNKYGHYSGHSSHYDYRFYPEKSLLDHLIEHHKHSGHHHLIPEPQHIMDDDDVGYGLVDEHAYPGSHQPLYYYLHDDEHHFH